jgi:DNA-binding transcriptional ArsR family regulator
MARPSRWNQQGAPSRSGSRRRGVYRVRRLDQVRALAHPLRLKLLEIFAAGESTTKQAAERLGESPTRLYHHVAALERAGLVRLARTRPNRGTVEKYYLALAQQFEVDSSVLPGGPGRRDLSPEAAVASQVLQATRDDLLRCGAEERAEDERPILLRMRFRAEPEEALRVRRELLEWLAALETRLAARSTPESPVGTLTVALVPPAPEPMAPRTRPRQGPAA